MGWLIAIPALLAGLIVHNDMMILTSALFAIAGSIGTLSAVLNQDKDKTKNKTE